ncbi:protein [Lentinula edodes]|uniref:Protein n=1 Tax=Lentinula edodes TaxID=5353 RepID=A0A1Q3EMY9_LENED|nr:protein [Lentinula edodes]
MSDDRQQQGEGASLSPALPPNGSSTEQAAIFVNGALQTISDRVNDGRLTPEAGHITMRRYLETVFRTFQLHTEYSLGGILQPWLEIINNHKQRLAHAECENHQREPRSVQLPSIKELLAGPARNATHREPPEEGDPGQQSHPGVILTPALREPRGENAGVRDRRESFKEEDTRANSTKRDCRDSSDEGVSRAKPTKRAKQDKNLFNWTADAFVKQSILSPKHRRIIKEVENFRLNLGNAIESIEQSGVNPIFPKKLWKSVLRDEYIELSEVHALGATDYVPKAPQPASNKFAALKSSTFAKPASTKAITDQASWRRAWRATADAISFAFADRCNELSAYEEHVGRLSDDNLPSFHHNVINYDKAVRQLIGSRRDILFDEFEHSEVARIRNMYLLPTGTHFSTSTFPAPRANQASLHPRNRAREICRKFNRGNCDGCERKHICATCSESGHGSHNCRKTSWK